MSTTPGQLQLPVELNRPTPRPLPLDFGNNFHNVNRKRNTILLIGSGIFCMALSFLPFVRMIAVYILPFYLLFWFGLLLCLIGIYYWFTYSKIKYVEDYVKHGEVAFAEVKELVKVPLGGNPEDVVSKLFVAKLEMKHPDDGRAVEVQAKSDPFDANAKLSPKFRVGDHVPVIWHKDRFNNSLRIYDFLEATPESSLQRPKVALWRSIGTMALVFAAVTAIVWSIYILGRYQPLQFSYDQALLPASIGVVLGVLSAIAYFLTGSYLKKADDAKNELAIASGEAFDIGVDAEEDPAWRKIGFFVVMALGFAAISTVVVMAACFAINAMFDKSPASEALVRITGMTETIHKMIYCEYQIEFEMEGVDDKLTFMSSPEHMEKFDVPLGIAQIHDGYLGWRWIDTIDPVTIDDEDLENVNEVID